MPPPLLARYPALVIAGPTSVGKSAVAIEVAEQCGGEIVGADAFQVYRGLAVLTAQPTAVERARVPHHLVGEVPLESSFDVAQYLARAEECLASIQARGKRAIIVGGTGLYLRGLRCGLAGGLPAADAGLRAELEALGLQAMQARLQSLDPAAAATIDVRNPRRLVRALEVCLLTNQPFSSFRSTWKDGDSPAEGVILLRDRTELNHLIDQRVEAMLTGGAVEEVAQAHDIGATARQALGFGHIQAFIGGHVDKGACIAAIQQATRRYAKRQLTWFRRETGLREILLSGDVENSEVVEQLAALANSLL